ncbi:Dynamin-like protein [Hyella patelloides LEGE 07179]|uniref:Dynamin-like protein n=1 Tax=Hyella patelloides LEGE 07179 TaxID=945734 RepID=A0A563VQS0_9CYAN|nr:dynamin family protein [Hyella patelloides]VEP13744.1 Dynamin-like protein [Hyella patelloides LEGE 07179]
MELTKTIRYDPQDLQKEFNAILDNLLQQVQKDSIKTTLGEKLTPKILANLDRISQRLQGNFSLVVVGDFKRGKSTLINALVGAEVVTTNVTPETVTINYLEHGEENKIEAVLQDGGKVDLTSEELYADRLEPILEKLPPVKYLKIKTPMEWLQGISLIDTPGTGDIFQRFDSDVQSIVEQADAIIFTISALSPLSLSEQNFLRVSLLPQDFPKVFFVVNMLDCARSNEEASRLLGAIQTKIDRLFPQAHLFGISAKDEFCRRESLSRPNPKRAEALEVAFAEFRQSLENSILLNRDLIHLSRLATQVDRDLNNWKSQILLLRNGMQSSQIELSQAIAQCQDESSELYTRIKEHKQQIITEVEQLSQETQGWLNEFLDRFESEAINSLSRYQLEDIRRHYPFFFADSLHKAVASCLDIHHPKIVAILEQAASNIVEDLQLLTQHSTDKAQFAQFSLAEQKWTDLDTLQAIAEVTPFNAIADILISNLKKSQSNTKVADYQKQLKNSFPQLRIAIIEQVQIIYQEIIQQLEAQIDTIYQQEIESSLSALEQAKDLSSQGEQKIALTNESLGNVLSLFTQVHGRLRSWQQKLWD